MFNTMFRESTNVTVEPIKELHKDKMSLHKDKMSLHKDKMSLHKDKTSLL